MDLKGSLNCFEFSKSQTVGFPSDKTYKTPLLLLLLQNDNYSKVENSQHVISELLVAPNGMANIII